jgi:hypothetical protein
MASSSQPIGLARWCQATTSPTAAIAHSVEINAVPSAVVPCELGCPMTDWATTTPVISTTRPASSSAVSRGARRAVTAALRPAQPG